LLRWAVAMHDHDMPFSGGNKRRRSRGEKSMNFDAIKSWIKRLLPEIWSQTSLLRKVLQNWIELTLLKNRILV
jgi:hypothetical protein